MSFATQRSTEVGTCLSVVPPGLYLRVCPCLRTSSGVSFRERCTEPHELPLVEVPSGTGHVETLLIPSRPPKKSLNYSVKKGVTEGVHPRRVRTSLTTVETEPPVKGFDTRLVLPSFGGHTEITGAHQKKS